MPCRDVVPAAFDVPVGGPFPNVLTADEGGPPSRAALLAVVVGEPGALVGDPVDVGRPVPHQAVAVAAQVGDPDVIAPDDEDVGPVSRHSWPPHLTRSGNRARVEPTRQAQRSPHPNRMTTSPPRSASVAPAS